MRADGIQNGGQAGERVRRFFLALSMLLHPLRAENSAAPLHKVHVDLLISARLTPGADKLEIPAVADVLMKSIGASQGLDVNSRTEVSGSVDEIKKRVDAKRVDIIILPTLDYLAVDRVGVLEPVMTMSAAQNPKGKIRYLLLVNLDSGITSLEGLQNKTVLTYTHSDEALNSMWTEVLLHQHRLPASDVFFRSISSTTKPSTSCLPVFFGKSDACVIDDASWNVLKELNPQLALKLKPIAESPLLLETVIGMHTNSRQYRAEILKGMVSLQDTPPGRQVLLFFKSRRSYSISRLDLEEVIDLRSNYQKILAAGGKDPRLHVAATPPPADLRRN